MKGRTRDLPIDESEQLLEDIEQTSGALDREGLLLIRGRTDQSPELLH